MLWVSWLQVSQTFSALHQRLNSNSFGGQFETRFITQMLESQWQELMEPLIESLLMSGDIAGADSVVAQLKELVGWGDMPDLAAAIAIRCQMPQVAARWKR
jgi:hypothetical protein